MSGRCLPPGPFTDSISVIALKVQKEPTNCKQSESVISLGSFRLSFCDALHDPHMMGLNKNLRRKSTLASCAYACWIEPNNTLKLLA